MTSLISWGTCLVLLPVMYALNVNEAKFKKNIAVGVTFPLAGREDTEVLGLLKGFRREQLIICLALAVLGGLCAALTWREMRFCLLFLWVDLLIVAEFVCTARWNGRLKAVKKARGWTLPTVRTASVTAAEPVDEDDKWLWGQLYYDPNDSRVIINARIGVNSTVNLAQRGGKAFIALSLALLLALPVTGLFFDAMCQAPQPLKVTDGILLAESWGKDYALPLEDVADAEVLGALPKGMTRVMGTGADSILKGRFSTPWGSATLCLDPRTGPWLKVTMADGSVYLLGGGASDAEAVYEALVRG